MAKIGRNDPCPFCDSGKHYKKCCMSKVDNMRYFSIKLKRAIRDKLMELHERFYGELKYTTWARGVNQIFSKNNDKDFSYYYGDSELLRVSFTEDNKVVVDVIKGRPEKDEQNTQ